MAQWPSMNCERCGIDASLTHRDIDGFAYYLCDACVRGWDAVRSVSADSSDDTRSPAR